MFCFHMVCEFLCYELHDLDTFWIQLGYDSDGILIRFRNDFDTISIRLQPPPGLVLTCVCYVFDVVSGRAAELLSEPCCSTWQKP